MGLTCDHNGFLHIGYSLIEHVYIRQLEDNIHFSFKKSKRQNVDQFADLLSIKNVVARAKTSGTDINNRRPYNVEMSRRGTIQPGIRPSFGSLHSKRTSIVTQQGTRRVTI